MRTILANAALIFLATVGTAAAEDYGVPHSTDSPLQIRFAGPPPTDADLARAEADRQADSADRSNDEIAGQFGVTDGREELFRDRPEGAPDDAGWNGFIDGGGAQLQYRW